jgi:plasmid stabilization system protein ParE
MDYTVIVSPRAALDFDEIVEFIARNSPAQAVRFGDRLCDAAQSLAEQPWRGTNVPGFPGVRKLVLSPYNIYYGVNERENVVAVLRFWHSSRNPKRLRFD